MTYPANKAFYLFDTETDCCLAKNCPDWTPPTTTTTTTTTSTTTTTQPSYWYASDPMQDVSDCIYGSDYAVDHPWMLYNDFNKANNLFESEKECCEKMQCPNYVPTTTTTTTSTTATSSTEDTPEETTSATTTSTTTTTEEPTTTTTTSTTTTKKPTTTTTTTKKPTTTTTSTSTSTTTTTTKKPFWYPDPNDDEFTCIYGGTYPNFYKIPSNKDDYLFDTEEACYNHWITEHPSTTPTDAPTTESPTSGPTEAPTTSTPTFHPTEVPTDLPTTSTPTVNPTEMPTFAPTFEPTNEPFWYPNFNTESPDCIFGSDYPIIFLRYAVAMNMPGFLEHTRYECCTAEGNSCPEGTYSEDELPETKEKHWFPDLFSDETHCYYGDAYESWMEREPATYFFDTIEACCEAHGCDPDADATTTLPTPSADGVIGYADEDFETGMDSLPWIHGGTTTHKADWRVTSSKSLYGHHSLKSGNLANKWGKSSDLSLKVYAEEGMHVEFNYLSLVSDPFDSFTFSVDGINVLESTFPSQDWEQFIMVIPPGEHTLKWSVKTGDSAPNFARSEDVDRYGTGFFYLDDFMLKQNDYAR